MESINFILLVIVLAIFAEVTYILAKLPKTTIKTKARPILVDTSVLMDGRIVSIAQTGFIGGTLVVPRSVIGELQFLADHADADKRSRARMGLDIVSELQQMSQVDVELLQDGSKAEEGVDERLLKLAKQNHASICTLDFNLNKVAVVEGIEVLNINDLAQSLRMAYLPGDDLSIELVQKGQENHQGIGYLPDGTMVVVDQAGSLIGQTVKIEVVRSLQTSAGKMMFAKRVETKAAKQPKTVSGRAVNMIEKQPVRGRRPSNPSAAQSEVVAVGKNQSSVKNDNSRNRGKDHKRQVQNTARPEKTIRGRQMRSKKTDHESALIELVENQK